MKKGIACLLLALVLICALPVQAEESALEIHTVEELLDMEPSGSYILMEDLDMTGVSWKPLDFSGSFDGNGHAILNLTVSQTGDTTSTTWDGNRKEYDTSFAGFFGILKDAEIKNLNLLNVRGLVESDTPCFMGGLAGYAENCAITNCVVTGCLELRAYDRMFGLGGVVGYGSGSVENCQIDVTLICVDTDAENRDEQFLGGVYAAGFMDVKTCGITIDGYISEHGYVHSGGIVGMYAEYPLGVGQSGYIKNNTLDGKITFFEDNTNRRAYCSAYVGEPMVSRYYLDGNTDTFQRDERTEYDVELRPEMCAEPVYTETVHPGGCDTYGYTTYTCQSCGYSCTDHYTSFEHTVTAWTELQAATTELEGLEEGNCDLCGVTVQRAVEILPEVTTTAPVEVPETEAEPEPVEPEAEDNSLLYILVGVDAALLILVIVIIGKLRRNKRRARRGRFARNG